MIRAESAVSPPCAGRGSQMKTKNPVVKVMTKKLVDFVATEILTVAAGKQSVEKVWRNRV